MKRIFTLCFLLAFSLISYAAYAAGPGFVSAKTISTTQIQVTFDAAITSIAQSSGSDFTIGGVTITGAAINGGNAAIVDLTVTTLSSSFSCTSCLAIANGAVTSAGGSNATINNKDVNDGIAPTNQNTIFTADAIKKGGVALTIVAGTSTDANWLAPAATTNFTANGTTITTAAGNATSITTPSSEGTYYLYVLDAAGNYSAASTAALTVDNTAPINQNTIFPSSASMKGGVALTIVAGSSTDTNWLAPAATTSFTANGTTITTAAGNATSITTPSSEGTYYLYVLDAAGNYSVASTAALTVDNTAPTNQNTIFTADATKKGGVALTIVAGTSTDANWLAPSGTTTFTANGTTITTAAGNATSITTPTDEGTYYLYVLDAAGNYSVASTAALTVDNTAPTNQNTIFTADATKKGGVVLTIVAGTSTDANWLAPAGTTVFTANGTTITTAAGNATSITTPSSEGTYYLYVLDAAGNYSAASTAALTVDNTAPTNQNTIFPSSISKKGGVALTIMAGTSTDTNWLAPAGTTIFTANTTTITTAAGNATSITTPSSEGTYYLFVLDEAGNYSAASTAALTVDNTAPTNQNTIFTSSTTKKGGVALTIAAGTSTDANWLAPAGTTTFTANGTTITTSAGNATSITTPSDEGTYYLYVLDAAGNYSVASTAALTVDNTAPTNQNTIFTADATKKGGVALTIVAGTSTDTNWLAPAGTTLFTANGTTITTAAGNATSITTPSTEGTYYLYILDAAGNYSVASTAALTVDNTAPTNQNTIFPSSISKKGGVALTIVAGTSTDTNWLAPSGTTVFTANGTTITTAAGNATSITTPSNQGTYYLYVLDAAGNYSAASTAALTVDNTAPTNQNTIFASSTTKKGGVALTIVAGTSTDTNWLAPAGTITFTANGTTITTAAGNATSITTPSSEGTYYLYVLDAAGNYSVASTAALTVDNTAPTNQNTIFSSSTSKKGNVALTIVAGTSTDTNWLAPAGTIAFTANGTTITTAAGNATSITTPTSEGSYYLYVLDAAGNYSVASTAALTVDNTAPSAFSGLTVTTVTGNVVSGYWNSTNASINIDVPVANDASLVGGTIQIQVDGGSGMVNVGNAATISSVPVASQTVNITRAQLTTASGVDYVDGATLSFTAIISDLAGNTTTGTTSATTLFIDETAPVIADDLMTLTLGVDKIEFSISEDLSINNGTTTGFSTSLPTLASQVYSGKGSTNLITLTSAAAGNWNSTPTVSYTPGNILDVAGNPLAAIVNHSVNLSQTPNLAAGDIAITGYNSDNDYFTFVFLKDVPTGTTINFTDKGWRETTSPKSFTNSVSGTGGVQESTLQLTTTRYVYAGTEVRVSGVTSATVSPSGTFAPLTTNSLDFSAGNGDALLVYQGTASDPTFIAGLNMNAPSDGVWTEPTSANDRENSSLPSGLKGLTNNVNAKAFAEKDNASYKYATAGTTAASPAAMLALLMTNSNWATADDLTGITIPASGGDNYTLPPDLSSVSPVHNSTSSAAPTLSITLNENVLAGTSAASASHDVELRRVSDNVLIQSWDIGDAGFNIPTGASNIATITNVNTLSDGVQYKVNVKERVFRNSVNNHTTGIDGSTTWKFTADAVLPTLSPVTITSSIGSDGFAKTGETITLAFTASEALSANPTVAFKSGGNNVTNSVTVTALGSNKYTATYVTSSSDTEGSVTFKIDFQDSHGNNGVSVTSTDNSSTMVFDKTAPAVSTLTIASDNTGSSSLARGPDAVSGLANTVTITLAASELLPYSSFSGITVTSGGVAIAGTKTLASVNAANPDDQYTLKFPIADADTDGAIAFSMTFTDRAGNSKTISQSDITNVSSVSVDNTVPSFTLVNIGSVSTANVAYAKAGDVVEVSMTTNEPLLSVPALTIGGQTSSNVTNPSGYNYTGSVTTDATNYAEGVLSFQIAAKDVAGNSVTRTTVTNSSSVIFDKTPPVVASIVKSSTLKGIGTTNGIVATSVDFVVTFTETNIPLSGINANGADFSVISDGNVAFTTKTVTGSGNTRTVTISGITGTGRISLGLADDDTILDAASNPLAGASDGSVAAAYSGNQYYTIVLPQPTNPVANFDVSYTNEYGLDLDVTHNSAGPQLATHYLFMAREKLGTTPFPTVTDGVAITDDIYDGSNDGSNIFLFNGDGVYVQNQVNSGGTSQTFSALTLKAGVDYEFIVYPYTKGNYSDDNIDYGTPVLITRSVPVASNSTLTSSPSSINISSTINTSAAAQNVFTFTVTDGSGVEIGSGKGYEYAPTRFKSLAISELAGTDNVTDWSAILAGAELYDINSPSTFVTATSITANKINFNTIPSSVVGDLGFIKPFVPYLNASAIQSKTYGLRVYFKPTAGVLTGNDNKILAFTLEDTDFVYNDGLNSTADHQLSSHIQSTTINSGSNTIDIYATKLVYTANPQSQIGVGINFSQSSQAKPRIEAHDANGNLDEDYNANFTVTPSTGVVNSHTAFSSGVLTLSSFNFNTAGSRTITIQGQPVTGTISYPALTGSGKEAVSTSVNAVISNKTTISDATAPASELISFSSITNSLPSNFNFDFTLQDDSGADGTDFTNNDALPTLIQTITIKQNTNNGTNGGGDTDFDDWTKSIAGAQLTDGTDVVDIVAGPKITGNSLVFDIPATSSMYTIADDQPKTYQLRIYLKNPVDATLRDMLDNKDFAFTVNYTDVIPNGTANTTSTMANSSSVSGDNRNKVIVTATQLDFTTQWATNATQSYDAPLSPTPTAKARDANQNLDIDYNTAASISGFAFDANTLDSKTYPIANNAVTVTNGVISFNSGLKITSAGDGAGGDQTNLVLKSGTLADGLSNSFILNYSTNSDIVLDASFAHPSDIPYINYQDTDITSATGVAVEQFTVRDGGSTNNDLDGTATTLSAITLNIENYQYLRRVALYDGATEIADLPVTAPNITVNSATNADMSFTGLTLFSVGDNQNKNLTVKVTFIGNAGTNSASMDHSVITFAVKDITAAGVSSAFLPGASTAAPALSANQNAIQVQASRLNFTKLDNSDNFIVPYSASNFYTSGSINTSFNPRIGVEADDIYDNRDLDFTGAITAFSVANSLSTINDPSGNFSSGTLKFPANFQYTSGNNVDGKLSMTAGGITSSSPSITIISSFDSWLYFDDSFSYTTRIPFVGMQETILTNSTNSVELARLVLSDGGAPSGTKNKPFGQHNDLDGAPTKIDQLTISLTNSGDLRAIALFDINGNKIGSDQIPAATVTFSNLSSYPALVAPDDDVAKFYIRASFNSTIGADLNQINIQITNVVWSAGSQFPTTAGTVGGIDGAGNGGDSSDPNKNYIDVVATSLDFVNKASDYAGVIEPVGPSYPKPSLPITNAATVHARDKFKNIDTDFDFGISSISITDLAGETITSPAPFTDGVLNLDGLVYTKAGNGTLKIVVNGIDSSVSGSGNSIPGQQVDVINVKATLAEISTTSVLKGGTPDVVLFGVTFTPEHQTSAEPRLKKFIITFDQPFQTTFGGKTVDIFKDFRLLESFENDTKKSQIINGVITKGKTAATIANDNLTGHDDYDLLTIDFGNAPRSFRDLSNNPTALSYYLMANVDASASISTPHLTPQISDGGYGKNDDTNIVTTAGTAYTYDDIAHAIGVIKGNEYQFASTRPPVLQAATSKPFNGQLNVIQTLDHIELVFDVPVWSLDGKAELFERGTNKKIADLLATTGNYADFLLLNNPNAPEPEAVNTLKFTIDFLADQNGVDYQLEPNTVYYVTIAKGSLNGSVGAGISDKGFNFYGGISSNGIYYFKISNPNPPVLSLAKTVFSNSTTGAFQTTFDQLGKAYFLVFESGTGYTEPTANEIETPSTYTNQGALVAAGNYNISLVSAAQTATFSASLNISKTYDVWIFAKNDAQPNPVRAAGPYHSNFSTTGTGPTFKIPPSSGLNSYKPNYSLCADSFVTLTDPIIIGETTTGDFNSASLQDFYILLPTGFQFDGTTLPTVKLNGSDFGGTPASPATATVSFTNNTIVHVEFSNHTGGSPSLDNIIITNLRVIGLAGSASGKIKLFAGSNVISSLVTGGELATIGLLTNDPINFTNSYSTQNTFPTPFTNQSVVTYIPDNYNDPNIPGAVRLLPKIDAANDYNASFFSGSGVTNDLLTLSAVARDAAFDITMTHTGPNGCVVKVNNQYLVYNHTSPISKKLGTAFKGTDQEGTAQALVNLNFPSTAPTIASDVITHKEFVGYKLINLTANLPASEIALNQKNQSSQIISGSAWQTLVSKIPFKVDSVNDNISPTKTYKDYKWDYTKVLNAYTVSNQAISEPYDNFKETGKTFGGNNYWKGGSLGKIEFTGAFQSMADFTLSVPFRQNVELFLPAVPIIEVVSGNTSYTDAADKTTNAGNGKTPDQNILSALYPNGYKGTPIFCEAGGIITLNGYPAALGGTSTGTFAIYDYKTYNFNSSSNTPLLSPALNSAFIDNGNGTATIDPTNINIKNNYNDLLITYTYKENNSPAVGTGYLVIRVTPNPVAKFILESDLTASIGNLGLAGGMSSSKDAYCAGIPLNFTSNSTIANDAVDRIASYSWDFGDGNAPIIQQASTKVTTTKTYAVINTYSVKLTVKSDKNCVSINTDNKADITVGAIPSVKFNVKGISTKDQIVFTDKTDVAALSGINSTSKINTITWDYGDGKSDATGKHNYTKPGHYNVREKLTTAIVGATSDNPGCSRTFDRHILVLDNKNAPYADDFEGNSTKWLTVKDSLNTNGLPSQVASSWKRGTPSSGRTVIKSTPDTGSPNSNVWATGLTGTYSKNERSFLYSPVIDMSSLARPMISFDANWDLRKDGVVLEYSTDTLNVSDPNKVWNTIGSNATGVKWFNDQVIGSKPGKQQSGDYGWSNTSTNWTQSKHQLSTTITGDRHNVVFRFGFASVNDGGEGFAFDNVRIGERTRTLILENFANTANPSLNEKTQNDSLKAFTSSVLGTEVIKLNYHVGFPGADPFNVDNMADPSARALYYNITTTPRTRLDGFGDDQDRLFADWGRSAFGIRSLQLAQAELDVKTDVKANGTIAVSVTVKPSGDAGASVTLPANTILQIAIVERSILTKDLSATKQQMINLGSKETSFEYVVKKMLPTAAGTQFGTSLSSGQTKTFGAFEWTPDGSKLYPSKDDLFVVVFLQNEATKEIYQSYMSNAIPDPPVITGLGDVVAADVAVYPNPADRSFTIELPGITVKEVSVRLVDQIGKIIETSKIEEGEQRRTLNTENLSEGLYIIQLGEGANAIWKKIVITHK